MKGTTLGAEQYRRLQSSPNPPKRKKLPWHVALLRWVAVLFMGLSATLSVSAGKTAEAGLWDLGEQMVANVMNVCNPNKVPYHTNPQTVLDTVLGTNNTWKPTSSYQGGASTTQSVAGGASLWSTYNPMVNAEGTAYISGDSGNTLTRGNVTDSWTKMIMNKGSNGALYFDVTRTKYSGEVSAGEVDALRLQFAGDASVARSYPVTPNGMNSVASNAPTVALQTAYEDAPSWVIHPTYSRYGFDSLEWTTYGSSCYDPNRYFSIVPQSLFTNIVATPTLFSFGVLRLALGNEFSGIFYQLVYPITSIIGSIFQPWAFLLATIIGLPWVYIKSKGGFGPVVGAFAWIGLMFFAFTQFTNNTRQLTEFTQGAVVSISGNLSCIVANQAFTKINTISEAGDAEVPVYDSNGNPVMENGKVKMRKVGAISADATSSDAAIRALSPGGDGNVTLNSLMEVAKNGNTPCGSYMDSVYNAFWVGIPLQVWAEGQVGSDQAARDRYAQSKGKIGWYQAFLNSMYINPNDAVGQAQLQAISRWNDGNYTGSSDEKNGISKLAQWTQDGNASDDWRAEPVTSLDTGKNATPWKTIPFLLNVKFMCKDDVRGSSKNDDVGDYSSNKWLYDGMCITQGNEAMISAVKGDNNPQKLMLVFIGSIMASIVFLFSVIVGGYILYQKFLWGWMLMFSPVIIGIAMFPNKAQKQFVVKYGEFVLANVIKQVVAVMILVVSVLALARIVFPDAISFSDNNVAIPWMMRPFIATVFLLSAILFIIPLKRLVMAGVRGDASAVQKTAETGKEVVSGAAKATAITAGAVAGLGLAAATGGGTALGTSALNMAGKGLKKSAYRTRSSGLTGAVKRGALNKIGNEAIRLSDSINENRNALADNLNVAPANGRRLSDGAFVGASLRDKLRRDRGIKKMLDPKERLRQEAHQMALDANQRALANGEALPYAVDAQGKLTPLARNKAEADMNSLAQGGFRNHPEFTASARNNALNWKKFEDAKAALAPQFTDEKGNVNVPALEAAARESVEAQNVAMLNRQGKIGDDLLALDKQRTPENRKYLDSEGNVTPLGMARLIGDAKMLDDAHTKLNNEALANELMSQNPEKYNSLATVSKPNAGRILALSEANELNYGKNGLVAGEVATRSTLAEGANVERLPQTKGYVHSEAPVIGESGLTREGAASLATQTANRVQALDPVAAEKLNTYAEVLGNPASTEQQIRGAHREAVTALAESKTLTPEMATVMKEIQEPMLRGASVAPNAARLVADSLTEAPAVKAALHGYADAVDTHGANSPEALMAKQVLTRSIGDTNEVAYSQIAKQVATPASYAIGSVDAAAAAFSGYEALASVAPVALGSNILGATPQPQPIAAKPEFSNEQYRVMLREHYGLSAASAPSNGDVFTEAEMQKIESGELAPVRGYEEARFAQGLNLGVAQRAESYSEALVSAPSPDSVRASYRQQLGFAPDAASMTAPLLSPEEEVVFQQKQEKERINLAVSGQQATEGSLSAVSLSDVASSYTSDVRSLYGLEESNKLTFGAALTPSEVKAIESGELHTLPEVSYANAVQDVPVTPAEVRAQARREVGLTDDGQHWAQPVFTYEEVEALNTARNLGVTFSGGQAIAPESAQGYEVNPVFYSTPSDKTPLGMNVASQEQLAKTFAARNDGTSYVNGVVVTPHSDAPVIRMAANTLPESAPEREAATRYLEAVQAGNTVSPEKVEKLRREAVVTLGAVAPQSGETTDSIGGVFGGWSRFRITSTPVEEYVPSDEEIASQAIDELGPAAYDSEDEGGAGQIASKAIELKEEELEKKLENLRQKLAEIESGSTSEATTGLLKRTRIIAIKREIAQTEEQLRELRGM